MKLFHTKALKLALIIGGSLLLAACSSPSMMESETTPPENETQLLEQSMEAELNTVSDAAEIQISNFRYNPVTVTVSAGGTITITNNDTEVHDVVARDGSFDSGDIAPGETVTMSAPDMPGTYEYYCTYHPYMVGNLIVE